MDAVDRGRQCMRSCSESKRGAHPDEIFPIEVLDDGRQRDSDNGLGNEVSFSASTKGEGLVERQH